MTLFEVAAATNTSLFAESYATASGEDATLTVARTLPNGTDDRLVVFGDAELVVVVVGVLDVVVVDAMGVLDVVVVDAMGVLDVVVVVVRDVVIVLIVVLEEREPDASTK